MSRHPTHWKEALHPRIPKNHQHGGEFVSRGRLGGAPKALDGVVRKAVGDVKPGDYILNDRGEPVKVHHAYLRKVGHQDHPGGSKVSKYVYYDYHGKIIRTRHGAGASGTSLIDTVPPDWASQTAERVDKTDTKPGGGGGKLSVKDVGVARKRPSAVTRGDVVVDADGLGVTVADVRVHKAGQNPHAVDRKVSTYTFYDSQGLPIRTRHGLAHTGTSQVEVVARRSGPPPPPKLTHPITDFREKVTDPAAIARLEAWEADMRKFGRSERYPTRREQEIKAYEARLRMAQGALTMAEANVRRNLKPDWYASDVEYEEAVAQETRFERAELRTVQDVLAKLRDPSQHTVAYMTDLDEPNPYGFATRTPAIPPNPERPLALYGNMLSAADRTWHTYVALDALEQRIPLVLHQKVAAYMAHTRNGGIYIGAKPVPDLDDLNNLRNEQPRGWGKGRTWKDVDGIHSSGPRVVGIGFTDNTVASISKVRGHHNMENSPLRGQPIDGTAALHEFGHALDNALAGGDGKVASQQAEFRTIHEAIKRYTKTRLNPYFRQMGGADKQDPSPGASEFFAESFGIWAKFDATPVLDRFGNPILAKDLGSLSHAEIPGGPITWQEQMLQYEFGISIKLARRLSRHYHKLLAEQGG